MIKYTWSSSQIQIGVLADMGPVPDVTRPGQLVFDEFNKSCE